MLLTYLRRHGRRHRTTFVLDVVLLLTIVAAISLPSIALASDPDAKVRTLLQQTWECPPKNRIVTRTHISWGTAYNHALGYENGVVTFTDERQEFLHNFEDNSLTTIHIRTSTRIPISSVASLAVSGTSLTLGCSGTADCIDQETSTALSTDCRGFCGGQPWRAAARIGHVVLRFCSEQDVADAALALSRLNGSISKREDVSPTTTSPTLTCWPTDPSGTPLNVRTSPLGKRTGRVLTNGVQTTVLGFEQDSKERVWGKLADSGYVLGQLLTCASPEDP